MLGKYKKKYEYAAAELDKKINSVKKLRSEAKAELKKALETTDDEIKIMAAIDIYGGRYSEYTNILWELTSVKRNAFLEEAWDEAE